MPESPKQDAPIRVRRTSGIGRASPAQISKRNIPSVAANEFDIPMSDGEVSAAEPVVKKKSRPLAKPMPTKTSNKSNRQRSVNNHEDEFDVPMSDHETPRTKLKKKLGQIQVRDSREVRPDESAHVRTEVSVKARSREFKSVEPQETRKRKRTPVNAGLSGSASLDKTHTAIVESAEVKQVPRLTARRVQDSNPAQVRAKPASRQMPSAPVRLAEMVSELEKSRVRPASTTRLSSPDGSVVDDEDISIRTPKAISSQMPSLTRSVSSTPKQMNMWEQLLPSDPMTGSPETNRLSRPQRRAVRQSPTPQKPVPRSKSDTTGPSKVRRRLVDQLKQSAPLLSSGSEDSDGSDATEEMDLNMLPQKSYSQPVPFLQVSFLDADPIPSQLSQVSDAEVSGPKQTYARTRSYLQEEDFEAGLLLALPSETPARPVAKGTFDLDEESDEGQSQGIRSIHELRAAGSKKRFKDEMDNLFDDIKDHSRAAWSRRRGALMELTSKLADKVFLDRFVESGCDLVLVEDYGSVTDSKPRDAVAEAIMLVLLIWLLTADLSRHTIERLAQVGVLEWLGRLLEDQSTMSRLAKNKKNNMFKASQSTFLDFMEVAQVAAFWEGASSSIPTLDRLAVKCMDLLVLRLRKNGQRKTLIRSSRAIEQLIRIATTDADEHEESGTGSRELALSVLEAESLSTESVNGSDMSNWTSSAIATLVNGLPRLIGTNQASARIVTLSLRLCLNVTNNRPLHCDMFAKNTAILSILDRVKVGFAVLANGIDATELDLLLLALGLMINLAEFSDPVRVCAVTCHGQALPPLLGTFLQGQQNSAEAESMEQSQTNVGYGYLAVLLGNLCLNESAKDAIRALLPRQDLSTVIRAVEEFVQYHQRVDKQAFDGEDGKEVWKTFTERLMAVAERIR